MDNTDPETLDRVHKPTTDSVGTNDERLQLLKSRLAVAKAFCKKPHATMKGWLDEYNIKDWNDSTEIRDKVRVGYLFRKTESEMPAIFDDQPDIFIKGKHPNTQVIEPIIEGLYDYLWTIQNLEEKIEDVGLYFEVMGMGFLESPWVTKTKKIMQPVTDPQTGQPPVDPMTGQPVVDPTTGQPPMQPMDVPIVDQPMAKVLNPFKLYFSPETRFNAVLDYEHCPYYFYEHVMSVDEVKARFGKTVDSNETLKVNDADVDAKLDSDQQVVKSDMKRVTVYEYYGCLPEENAKGIKNDQGWAYDKDYHGFFSGSDELLMEENPYDNKPLFILGNYGLAGTFFKFGEAKHLMPLIQEYQVYRTLILRHLRKSANAKLMTPTTANLDEAAFRDPKGDLPVKYDMAGGAIPSYLQPPQLSPVVKDGIEIVQQDLEKTAASFDLANGGGQSTVKTPEGIRTFSDAMDKATRRKRKKIARFIRNIVEFQFNQVSQNWKPDDGKTLAIIAPEETDPQTGAPVAGGPQMTQVTAEVLQVIGGNQIMYNLDIEVESLAVNRAAMRQDAVDLFTIGSQHPDIFNLQELAKDLLQSGFGKRDADRFLTTAQQQQQMAQAGEKPKVALAISADANTPVGMKLLETEGLITQSDANSIAGQNMALQAAGSQQMLPPGQDPTQGGDPTQTAPPAPQGPPVQ